MPKAVEERPQRTRGPRRVACAVVFACVSAVLVCAGAALGQGSYYLVSMLVIACALVPFFVSLEARPQARELVVLAVLCALAVVSRLAFGWLPHFKPMVGIIMIAGVAFGAQTGFLTGSVSAFVSNFAFGQGPWTPWQMLAFGLAGFVAGLLADYGKIPRANLSAKERVALSAGGGAFVVCVVGPLLDTCSLLTMVSVITPASAAAIYLSGLPVNCVHAAAVFLTLLLVANPLLEKLERIKTKYGLME